MRFSQPQYFQCFPQNEWIMVCHWACPAYVLASHLLLDYQTNLTAEFQTYSKKRLFLERLQKSSFYHCHKPRSKP